MLVFRILCAIAMAWAMNWTLSRPAADLLNEEIPEFGAIMPWVAALIGFVNLAPRQGWGGIVAVANGVWAGVLSVALCAASYLFVAVLDTSRLGNVDSHFLGNLMMKTTADLFDLLATMELFVACVSATAIVGVVTEVLHWALVKLRELRGIKERNERRAHRPSMYGH
ncbi:MAG: hypothetical protein ACFBSD_01695 [Paracoccaceae bacterium]